MSPFLHIIEALNQRHVKFVVVGGFAAVVHGVNRLTADLDLVIDLAPAEATRAIDALLAIGFKSRLPVDPHAFADAETRTAWMRDKNMMVFSLFGPTDIGVTVDLFVDPPIAFERLKADAAQVMIDGVDVSVASIDHLVEMKRLSGRPLDLRDIADLNTIQAHGSGASES